MKAVGCVVAVLVLAVGGFIALTVFVLGGDEDQSALTERVELTVIDPEDVGTGSDSGYRFDYAYEQGGQWWGADRFVNERFWSPGQPITACVDPADPGRHVVTLRNDTCGEETIVADSIQEATPRSAP